MGRQHIEASARSAAPPGAVYALLVDGSTWPTWSGHDEAELVERGEGDGDGVGAVRILRRGRTRSRERVVELIPDRRLGYVLLAGLPLRDYRANVDLAPERDGTAIRWHAVFDAKIPGTGPLFAWALGRFLATATAGLAARAAEVAAAGGASEVGGDDGGNEDRQEGELGG